MEVHVATFREVKIDANGQPRVKNGMTIGEVLGSTTEIRVDIDPDNPNTNGYPDVKTYLTREAGDGFMLRHMDQTFIITYSE